MTDPCDPSLASLRCWEHDDCLEHPELALACGPDRDYPWGCSFLTSITDALWGRGEVWSFVGDGYAPYGYGAGHGIGYGIPHTGDGFGKGPHDGFGLPLDCEEEVND